LRFVVIVLARQPKAQAIPILKRLVWKSTRREAMSSAIAHLSRILGRVKGQHLLIRVLRKHPRAFGRSYAAYRMRTLNKPLPAVLAALGTAAKKR